jgi:RNA polymerase-interacting CarD/CdnL/TRCF family regulator
MSFNQGDHVVHQKFGVGVIVSIEEMSFSGSEPRLYYHVDFSKTTVWVAVDDELKGGLRFPTSKTLLNRYRILLSSSPIKFDPNYQKRKIELGEKLGQGTFQGLCEIVRDLHALNVKKPLNTHDKAFYERVLEVLIQEWSEITGITHFEAKSEIESFLYDRKLSPVNA